MNPNNKNNFPQNNNYNNNYNNYNNPNQMKNTMNPNINYNQQKQQITPQQYQNPNNRQQYPNNQNNQNRPPINPYQEKLRVAYNLFTSGVNDYKNYSLELALDKFEKADKAIKEAYPHIQNIPNMKETTDKFQKQVTHYLKSTEYQIAHKFDYKPMAGFAAVDYNSNTKNEIAQMVRDAQTSNQKYNYIPQNNTNYNNNQQANNNQANNIRPNNQNNVKKDDKAIVTNDLRDKILSEIVETKPDVKFDDVVGLVEAKQILKEIIYVLIYSQDYVHLQEVYFYSDLLVQVKQ